jgi:predicted ester cyclase
MKAPEPEKTMTGADLATKYQKCVGMINDGKFDDFKKDCVADEFTVHEYGQDMKGDMVMGYFQAMKKAMPDWKLAPQLVIISGRNILAVELTTGTQSGELAMPGMPPVPATNKKVGQLFFHKLTINDQNKATEEWAFDDPATMMGQLGLAPKDAPPTRPAIDKGLDGAPIVVVTADDDKEHKNLEAWKKGDEVFNAHKLPDLMAMVTDDALESDQAMGKDNKGKKEIEAGLKQFWAAFSDIKATTSETFAAGDYVVAIGKMEGTNDHDMGKMKKTGKKVSLDFAEIAHVKDGKVDTLWRFHSGLQFAMQMGLMPAPGAAPGGDAAPADKKDDKGAAKKDEKKPATK